MTRQFLRLSSVEWVDTSTIIRVWVVDEAAAHPQRSTNWCVMIGTTADPESRAVETGDDLPAAQAVAKGIIEQITAGIDPYIDPYLTGVAL